MSLNTAFIGELKHESVNTRKMIERVPSGKLNWQPHEKSMKLGRLATHIAELLFWFEKIITADEFDFAAVGYKSETKENTDAVLKLFDKKLALAINILETASDENLNSMWTFRRDEHVIFRSPKKVALRSLAYNHIYHHRGQLSVYLRLLDIPVPGMYGPSADERLF